MPRASEKWVIADTHFNHPMLVVKGYRPPDYEQRIIDNWKKMVHPDDVIFHLGDVIMRSQSMLGGIMEQLPGHKILVRGNHDRQSIFWFIKRGFSAVVDSLRLDEIYMTHEPSQLIPGTTANLHGHTHGDDHREHTVEDFQQEVSIESSFMPFPLDVFR